MAITAPKRMLPSGRGLVVNERARRVRRTLSAISGFELANPYEGHLSVGEQMARLRLEPDDTISVAMPVRFSPPALSALEANANLTGNVRFAIRTHGPYLVADSWLDGELHLSKTLRLIQRGFIKALGQSVPGYRTRTAPTTARDEVRAALQGLPWGAEAIVEQEQGWELRPRLRGEPVPVQVTLERSHLQFSRLVLRHLPAPDQDAAHAVADHSLRLNAQVRHARLVVAQGRLLAQARLHGGQIQAARVAATAYAVAIAAHRAEAGARILVEQPRVAASYRQVLCLNQQTLDSGRMVE